MYIPTPQGSSFAKMGTTQTPQGNMVGQMGTRQTPQGIMICQDGYNPNTPRNHGWPNGFNPTPQGIIMNGQHTWAQSKHPNNGLIAWHCLSFWSSMHHDMEPMIVNLCLF
jgi:hypothetical protein